MSFISTSSESFHSFFVSFLKLHEEITKHNATHAIIQRVLEDVLISFFYYIGNSQLCRLFKVIGIYKKRGVRLFPFHVLRLSHCLAYMNGNAKPTPICIHACTTSCTSELDIHIPRTSIVAMFCICVKFARFQNVRTERNKRLFNMSATHR